ncbi:hypothetical protein VPHD479_0369 [Vibrio phage D479]
MELGMQSNTSYESQWCINYRKRTTRHVHTSECKIQYVQDGSGIHKFIVRNLYNGGRKHLFCCHWLDDRRSCTLVRNLDNQRIDVSIQQ